MGRKACAPSLLRKSTSTRLSPPLAVRAARVRAAQPRARAISDEARPLYAHCARGRAFSPLAGNAAMPAGSGYIQNGVGWVANFTDIYSNISVPLVNVLTPGCPSGAGKQSHAHTAAFRARERDVFC